MPDPERPLKATAYEVYAFVLRTVFGLVAFAVVAFAAYALHWATDWLRSRHADPYIVQGFRLATLASFTLDLLFLVIFLLKELATMVKSLRAIFHRQL